MTVTDDVYLHRFFPESVTAVKNSEFPAAVKSFLIIPFFNEPTKVVPSSVPSVDHNDVPVSLVAVKYRRFLKMVRLLGAELAKPG